MTIQQKTSKNAAQPSSFSKQPAQQKPPATPSTAELIQLEKIFRKSTTITPDKAYALLARHSNVLVDTPQQTSEWQFFVENTWNPILSLIYSSDDDDEDDIDGDDNTMHGDPPAKDTITDSTNPPISNNGDHSEKDISSSSSKQLCSAGECKPPKEVVSIAVLHESLARSTFSLNRNISRFLHDAHRDHGQTAVAKRDNMPSDKTGTVSAEGAMTVNPMPAGNKLAQPGTEQQSKTGAPYSTAVAPVPGCQSQQQKKSASSSSAAQPATALEPQDIDGKRRRLRRKRAASPEENAVPGGAPGAPPAASSTPPSTAAAAANTIAAPHQQQDHYQHGGCEFCASCGGAMINDELIDINIPNANRNNSHNHHNHHHSGSDGAHAPSPESFLKGMHQLSKMQMSDSSFLAASLLQSIPNASSIISHMKKTLGSYPMSLLPSPLDFTPEQLDSWKTSLTVSVLESFWKSVSNDKKVEMEDEEDRDELVTSLINKLKEMNVYDDYASDDEELCPAPQNGVVADKNHLFDFQFEPEKSLQQKILLKHSFEEILSFMHQAAICGPGEGPHRHLMFRKGLNAFIQEVQKSKEEHQQEESIDAHQINDTKQVQYHFNPLISIAHPLAFIRSLCKQAAASYIAAYDPGYTFDCNDNVYNYDAKRRKVEEQEEDGASGQRLSLKGKLQELMDLAIQNKAATRGGGGCGSLWESTNSASYDQFARSMPTGKKKGKASAASLPSARTNKASGSTQKKKKNKVSAAAELAVTKLIKANFATHLCDSADLLGRSALHMAVITGNERIISALFLAGCNPNPRLPFDYRTVESFMVMAKEQGKPCNDAIALQWADASSTPISATSSVIKEGAGTMTAQSKLDMKRATSAAMIALSMFNLSDDAHDQSAESSLSVAPHATPLEYNADVSWIEPPVKAKFRSTYCTGARQTLPLCCSVQYATPLHLAALSNNLRCMELLLTAANAIDVNARTVEGVTPLHFAARRGNRKAVELLCRVPDIDMDAMDRYDRTPMHVAAGMGHAAVVEVLWSKGADVDALDAWDWTPMHYAAMEGHVSVVQHLVIAGSRVQEKDEYGVTAAHLAAERGHVDILEKLLMAGFMPDTPLTSECKEVAAVAAAVHYREKEHQKDDEFCSDGQSPVEEDGESSPSAWTFPISLSPWPICIKAGVTALHLAAAHGHAACVEKLLRWPAKADVIDQHEFRPIDYALSNGHLDVVDLLLNCGYLPQGHAWYKSDGTDQPPLSVVTKLAGSINVEDSPSKESQPRIGVSLVMNDRLVPQILALKAPSPQTDLEAIDPNEIVQIDIHGRHVTFFVCIAGIGDALLDVLQSIKRYADKNGKVIIDVEYALALAIKNGQGRTVAWLISSFSIKQDRSEFTQFLHIIPAMRGNSEMLQVLEDGGFNTMYVDKSNMFNSKIAHPTALIAALAHGHPELAEAILDRALTMEDAEKETYLRALSYKNWMDALGLATYTGYQSIVAKLLDSYYISHSPHELGPLSVFSHGDRDDVLDLHCSEDEAVYGDIFDEIDDTFHPQPMTLMEIAAWRGRSKIMGMIAFADDKVRDHLQNKLSAVQDTDVDDPYVEKLLQRKEQWMFNQWQTWQAPRNPLYYLAARGDLASFTMFFQRGTALITKVPAARLLCAAIEGECPEMVGMLLKNKVVTPEKCEDAKKTPVHAAAAKGSLRSLLLLQQAGFDLSALNHVECSPLHFLPKAFSSDMQEDVHQYRDFLFAADLLLSAGCKVDAPSEQGAFTPLHVAAECGSAELMMALTDSATNIDIPDVNGWTPLFCAANEGNYLVTELLLIKDANPFLLSKNQQLPLHLAAEGGHVHTVTHLIEAMMSPRPGIPEPCTAYCHRPDLSNSTPVQLAAAEHHVECVRVILDMVSGDPHQRYVPGPGTSEEQCRTALHLAAAQGLGDIVSDLLASQKLHPGAKDAEGWTPVHHAAARGCAKIVAQLLVATDEPDEVTKEGDTALHKAALAGWSDVVAVLLDAGADVNIRNATGSTALYNASSQGHTAIMKMLMDAGACPNMTTSNGATPLYIAANNGWADAVQMLLACNADPSATISPSGGTALHAAAVNGHAETIKRLHGHVDIDVQSGNGSTALHNAVANGYAEAVKALIDAHADLDVENYAGNTPLHLAAGKGWIQIVEELLRADADHTLKNHKGLTAVQSAANSGFFDVVLKLVLAGAHWRQKGDNDVVKLLSRKTTLKTSYLEGRLRLAEKERQRNISSSGAGGSGTSAPGSSVNNTVGRHTTASAKQSSTSTAAVAANTNNKSKNESGHNAKSSDQSSKKSDAKGNDKQATDTPTAFDMRKFEAAQAHADAVMASLLEEESAEKEKAQRQAKKKAAKKEKKAAQKRAEEEAAAIKLRQQQNDTEKKSTPSDVVGKKANTGDEDDVDDEPLQEVDDLDLARSLVIDSDDIRDGKNRSSPASAHAAVKLSSTSPTAMVKHARQALNSSSPNNSAVTATRTTTASGDSGVVAVHPVASPSKQHKQPPNAHHHYHQQQQQVAAVMMKNEQRPSPSPPVSPLPAKHPAGSVPSIEGTTSLTLPQEPTGHPQSHEQQLPVHATTTAIEQHLAAAAAAASTAPPPLPQMAVQSMQPPQPLPTSEQQQQLPYQQPYGQVPHQEQQQPYGQVPHQEQQQQQQRPGSMDSFSSGAPGSTSTGGYFSTIAQSVPVSAGMGNTAPVAMPHWNNASTINASQTAASSIVPSVHGAVPPNGNNTSNVGYHQQQQQQQFTPAMLYSQQQQQQPPPHGGLFDRANGHFLPPHHLVQRPQQHKSGVSPMGSYTTGGGASSIMAPPGFNNNQSQQHYIPAAGQLQQQYQHQQHYQGGAPGVQQQLMQHTVGSSPIAEADGIDDVLRMQPWLLE